MRNGNSLLLSRKLRIFFDARNIMVINLTFCSSYAFIPSGVEPNPVSLSKEVVSYLPR